MGKHKGAPGTCQAETSEASGCNTLFTGTCSPAHATPSALGPQGCTAGWARGWALTAPHAAVAAAAAPTAALRYGLCLAIAGLV